MLSLSMCGKKWTNNPVSKKPRSFYVMICEDPLCTEKIFDLLQCARQFAYRRDCYSEELRRTRVDIEYRREIRRATNGANIDMTPGTKLYFVLFSTSVLSLDILVVFSN
jgi:NAD-dependent oxidoreductase involved in siderophore biosynthesis